jgi:hypothetical protein
MKNNSVTPPFNTLLEQNFLWTLTGATALLYVSPSENANRKWWKKMETDNPWYSLNEGKLALHLIKYVINLRCSGNTSPSVLNLDNGRKWVVNLRNNPPPLFSYFTPGETAPSIHWLGRWVVPELFSILCRIQLSFLVIQTVAWPLYWVTTVPASTRGMTYIYSAWKNKPGTIIRSSIQPVHIFYPLDLQGEEE